MAIFESNLHRLWNKLAALRINMGVLEDYLKANPSLFDESLSALVRESKACVDELEKDLNTLEQGLAGGKQATS